MKFSFKIFLSKCDQICKKLRIRSHLLKKSFLENFIFCAVHVCFLSTFRRTLSSISGFQIFSFNSIKVKKHVKKHKKREKNVKKKIIE